MKLPHLFSALRCRQLENRRFAPRQAPVRSGTSTPEISAAGDAHMPADARAIVPAIDDEVMAFRLQSDRPIDRLAELLVVSGGPQRLAQIGGILVAAAGMQRAGAGDPHPVAGIAEIMGHRRDEAELAAGFADMHITRWPAGVVGKVGQGVLLAEPRA